MKHDPQAKVSIGEWASGLIDELQVFADHWNAKADAEKPKRDFALYVCNYPETLTRGEWDEQFLAFTQNIKDEGD